MDGLSGSRRWSRWLLRRLWLVKAHRTDSIADHLAHARQRLDAAQQASGDLQAYHIIHVCHHLADALDHGHQLTASVRAHYPAEAAELDALNKVIGMAKALSPEAKAATFAHLLETIMYHAGHASRHADAMREQSGPPGLWAFNFEHASVHADGALDHAQMFAEHIRDNYPAEAKFLRQLGQLSISAQAGRRVKSWRQAGSS